MTFFKRTSIDDEKRGEITEIDANDQIQLQGRPSVDFCFGRPRGENQYYCNAEQAEEYKALVQAEEHKGLVRERKFDNSYEYFKGELKGYGAVCIASFYPLCVEEFWLQVRAAAAIKLHAGPFAVLPIAVDTKKKMMIFPEMDYSLDELYTQIKKMRKEYISPTAAMRILYDVARGLYYMHLNSTTVDEQGKSFDAKGQPFYTLHRNQLLERDLDSSNIKLACGWKRLVAELKPAEMDSAPPIAYIGARGVGTTASPSFRYLSAFRGDVIKEPFDHQENIFYEPTWIWRLGLLIFEVATKETFASGTLFDAVRIILNRLSPESTNLREAYRKKWYSADVVSPFLYEFAQIYCWQPHVECRATFAEAVKILKWAYMEEIAKANTQHLPEAQRHTSAQVSHIFAVLLGYSLVPPKPLRIDQPLPSVVPPPPRIFWFRPYEKIPYTKTIISLKDRFEAFEAICTEKKVENTLSFEEFSTLIAKIDRDPSKKDQVTPEGADRAIDFFAINKLWQVIYPTHKLFPLAPTVDNQPLISKTVMKSSATLCQENKKSETVQNKSVNTTKEEKLIKLADIFKDKSRDIIFDRFMKYRILYDISQFCYADSIGYHRNEKHILKVNGEPVGELLGPPPYRLQINNIYLVPDWKESILNAIGSDAGKYPFLPTIAVTGDAKNTKNESDLFDCPPRRELLPDKPDGERGTNKHETLKSTTVVWRLGILAFEIFCEVSWNDISPDDQRAIVNGKEVSSDKLQDKINRQWKTLSKTFIGHDVPPFWKMVRTQSLLEFRDVVRHCLLNEELNRDRLMGIGYPDFDPKQFGHFDDPKKTLPSLHPIINQVTHARENQLVRTVPTGPEREDEPPSVNWHV